MGKPLKVMITKRYYDSYGNIVAVGLTSESGDKIDRVDVKAVEEKIKLGRLMIVEQFRGKSEHMSNKIQNTTYVDTLRQGDEYPLYVAVEYEFGKGADTEIVKYGPFYREDIPFLNKLKTLLNRCIELSNSGVNDYFSNIGYAKNIAISSYFSRTGLDSKPIEEFSKSIERIDFEFLDDPLSNNGKLAKIKRYGICRNMVDSRKTFYVTVLFSIDNDRYRKRRTFGPFYTDTKNEKMLFENFKSTLGSCLALDTDDYCSENNDLNIWTHKKKVNSPEIDRIAFKLEKDPVLGGDARILVFDIYNNDRSKYAIVEKFIKWDSK